MTMNPLPPQAYTKDTLTKAYMWLVHQNASIRELATTPDILCSLFLKAQRSGDESLDAPSIQNFKKELKSLAGMMGELEGKNSLARPSQQAQFVTPTFQPPLPIQPQLPIQPPPPKQAPVQSTSVSLDMLSQLDGRSKEMISEVREQLNLSCDMEALRLLISLGYSKAKTLCP
ncbi:MAG: hypothetical protein ACXWRE_03345 [Pseudobdellovibrionaceae bacterium]